MKIVRNNKKIARNCEKTIRNCDKIIKNCEKAWPPVLVILFSDTTESHFFPFALPRLTVPKIYLQDALD